jgi:hypothetical protein
LAFALCLAFVPSSCLWGQQSNRTTSSYEQANAASAQRATRSKSQGQILDAGLQSRPKTRAGSQVFAQRNARTTNYVPRHLRQDVQAEGKANSTVQAAPADSSSAGAPIQNGEVYGSGVVESFGDVADGEWTDNGCSDCGDCGSCDTCGPCGACDIDGCPRPPCWLDGFGGILFNGEYFIGAEAHSELGTFRQERQGSEDCGFGFYGGGNFGAPLNWLTCGFLSGQIGLNSIHSDLGGQTNGDVNNQLFVTGGFFRRVDYGLQGGVVADFLDQDWNFDPRVVQIRSELSYAFPNRYSFGFRAATGVQDFDDPQSRIFDRQTVDWYRFFSRHGLCNGGYTELNGGWTEGGQGLLGADLDVPLGEYTAVKSGFTYVFTDDAHDFDGWNIFVGVTLRPRGRGWYDHYHRPLFDVANNGTLIVE